MTAPEFSRPVRIDTIGDAPRPVTIAADPAELAALAGRFALTALDRLAADAMLRRDGEIVIAEGSVSGDVVQACVVTGAPLPATVTTAFALRFVPELGVRGEEMELDAGELDDIPYADGTIDLGEAVAETLALALDPFPRAPDAEEALKAAGVLDEGETGPFAGLKALKARLGG